MIINADDFGISKQVNDAVCKCFNRGIINRTTLMVNMPLAEAAAEAASKNGFFERVGLHINLTEGPALSERCRNSELCDENGNLRGVFHVPIASRFFLNKSITEAIREEAEMQINKYKSMGFTLMHADSHNYTHTYWSVAREVNPLLTKHGFRSVRISRNIPPEDISLVFRPYKFLYNKKLSALTAQEGKIDTTDYFGEVKDYEVYCRTHDIDGDAEVMTHPITDKNGAILDTDKPMIDSAWIKKYFPNSEWY